MVTREVGGVKKAGWDAVDPRCDKFSEQFPLARRSPHRGIGHGIESQPEAGSSTTPGTVTM